MNKNDLTAIFGPLFENYNKQFTNNLRNLYPLDTATGTTFNEANFTSNFIKALYMSDDLGHLATWDEFPVPEGTRIENLNRGGMIDSLIIDHKNKRILILEAKRLRQLNHDHPYETVADIKTDPASLISDMARAIQVANSDILSSRIWKAGKLFEPLGEEYGDYKVFGLALCGIWTTDRLYGKAEVEEAFMAGAQSLIKQNPVFEGLCLLDGVTFVEEIKDVFPREVSDKWQFFTLLYTWEIERNQSLYKSFSRCLDIKALASELNHLSIAVDDRSSFWYLYPSCFAGTYVSNRNIKNKLWVYKHDPSCKLYAYSPDERTIKLPDIFTQDDVKKKWVSMHISPDSVIDDLRNVFEEIIKLNP